MKLLHEWAVVAWLLAGCHGLQPQGAAPGPAQEEFTVTRQGELQVTLNRTFQAERNAVFEAMTTPALIRQWLSANGRELAECEVDLREGGSYRYLFRMAGGQEFGMRGRYLEVHPPHRLVYTESYDGSDWPPLLVTARWQEQPGPITQLEISVAYPDKAICDYDIENLRQAG
ncbi:MAG: SRPBCC domain-containing protein [Planctomycetota bacterium]